MLLQISPKLHLLVSGLLGLALTGCPALLDDDFKFIANGTSGAAGEAFEPTGGEAPMEAGAGGQPAGESFAT